MAGLKNSVFFLSFLLYFVNIEALLCIPGTVPNITFSTANQIKWATVNNPSNCVIAGYVIDVFDAETHAQLQYQTSSTIRLYTLPSLDMCKTYSFEVHALTTTNVLGPSIRITATTPPAANMNLTLNVDKAIFNNVSQISLTWNPSQPLTTRCISYYRVVYWDETNNPKDVYVPTNKFILTATFVPCMTYKFQVSAIIKNPDNEGPVTEVSWAGYTAVPSIPQLVTIATTVNSVKMTWKVPTYAESRCNLISLSANTLGLPANRSATHIAIQDTAQRPNIILSLTNLTANTIYTSVVTLQNSAGTSKPVTVNYQTSDKFVFNYENDLFY